MKKQLRKLNLNRETVRNLEKPGLARVFGGAGTVIIADSNVVSQCANTCTNRLDGCA